MSDVEIEPGTHWVSVEPTQSTMAKHGRRTLVGGKALELVPPGLPLMRRIGQDVDSDPGIKDRVGLRIMRIMALWTHAIGDLDLRELTIDRRVVEIGQLGVAEMFYQGLLQLAALDAGNYMAEVDSDCPKCGRKLPKKVPVDLREIKVFVYDEDPIVKYRFADPWKLLGSPVKELTLSTPTLARAMQRATKMEGDVLQSLDWVAASIIQADGRDTVVTAEQLAAEDQETGRGMSLRDWDGLKEAHGHALGGTSRKAPYVHPACDETLWVPVEWAEVFFALSRG